MNRPKSLHTVFGFCFSLPRLAVVVVVSPFHYHTRNHAAKTRTQISACACVRVCLCRLFRHTFSRWPSGMFAAVLQHPCVWMRAWAAAATLSCWRNAHCTRRHTERYPLAAPWTEMLSHFPRRARAAFFLVAGHTAPYTRKGENRTPRTEKPDRMGRNSPRARVTQAFLLSPSAVNACIRVALLCVFVYVCVCVSVFLA